MCDGRQIALVGWCCAEVWDLDSCTRVWESDALYRMGSTRHIAFSPQNDLLTRLVGADLHLLDAVSGEELLKLHSGWDVAWAADGTRLLTSDWHGRVCVWDVASARSTKHAPLLFQCETGHNGPSCSFFDGHRSILTDHGVFPVLPEHRPPCAADDHMPPETAWGLRNDGWIWQLGGGMGERRVCWLPPAYRPD
jgi:WD40 repeat protein